MCYGFLLSNSSWAAYDLEEPNKKFLSYLIIIPNLCDKYQNQHLCIKLVVSSEYD